MTCPFHFVPLKAGIHPAWRRMPFLVWDVSFLLNYFTVILTGNSWEMVWDMVIIYVFVTLREEVLWRLKQDWGKAGNGLDVRNKEYAGGVVMFHMKCRIKVKHKYCWRNERAACSVATSISRDFCGQEEKAKALPPASVSEAASVLGDWPLQPVHHLYTKCSLHVPTSLPPFCLFISLSFLPSSLPFFLLSPAAFWVIGVMAFYIFLLHMTPLEGIRTEFIFPFC